MEYSPHKTNVEIYPRPILVINETLPRLNRAIREELKRKGLPSRVYSIADLPAAVSSRNLPLIVSIVDSEVDTPFIQYSGIMVRKSTPKVVLYRRSIVDSAKHKSINPHEFDEEIAQANLIAHEILQKYHDIMYRALTTDDSSDFDYSSNIGSLIERLELATDAISDLRINSATDSVSELRNIVSSLKIKFKNVDANTPATKNDLRSIVYEVLTVISRIYDHVDNSRLAAMIVAGATTAIMGCSGLAAPITAAILLASWHGKEAFITAITKARPLRID